MAKKRRNPHDLNNYPTLEIGSESVSQVREPHTEPETSDVRLSAFHEKVIRYIRATPGCKVVSLGRKEIDMLAGHTLPVEIFHADKESHFEII